MNKQKALIKNTLILAFGKVASQLIAFLLLPLYTFFLSPAEYGAVDLIVTYIALIVPAATLQLEMAAFRFLVDARGNEDTKRLAISNILQIACVALVACLVLFGLVELFVAVPYAPLVAANIAVTIFCNLFLQMARGMGENKKFAIASIATGITTLAGALLLIVVVHMGASGFLLSMALANAAAAVYLFISLRLYRYVNFKKRDALLQKDLIAYSFPLVPNGVSWWVINVSDRTIVSVALGVAANGIYAVANKYAAIFTSAFSIFQMSWTEAASVHINSADRDKFFSDTINASVRLFGALGLGLVATIPLVFSFIVDAEYADAYLYIPILVIAAFFNAMVSLYGAIYIAKKLTKQVANTSLVAAAINIGLTVAFVALFGLYAAALSTAIAYFVMTVYRHYDAKKYVKIHYSKRLLAVLCVAYGVVLLTYYMNNVVLSIIGFVFAGMTALFLNRTIVAMGVKKVTHILKDRKQTI